MIRPCTGIENNIKVVSMHKVICMFVQSLAKTNPPAVNASDMFKKQLDNPWTMERCPFINSKLYATNLAKHVAIKTPQFVKIIIGPKDVGKSTGIKEIKPKWKEVGHLVVDLKGTSHCVNGKNAMELILKDLMGQLITSDRTLYGRIYDCTYKNVLINGVLEG